MGNHTPGETLISRICTEFLPQDRVCPGGSDKTPPSWFGALQLRILHTLQSEVCSSSGVDYSLERESFEIIVVPFVLFCNWKGEFYPFISTEWQRSILHLKYMNHVSKEKTLRTLFDFETAPPLSKPFTYLNQYWSFNPIVSYMKFLEWINPRTHGIN